MFACLRAILHPAPGPQGSACSRPTDGLDHPQPFRLPAAEVVAVAAFVVANLIIYWTGWDVLWRLYIAIAVGFVLLGIGHIVNPSEFLPRLDWRGGFLLGAEFIGPGILSLPGPKHFRGAGVLPFGQIGRAPG